MTEVIEALDDAIDSLQEARDRADTGTAMMINSLVTRTKKTRNRTQRINERNENDG